RGRRRAKLCLMMVEKRGNKRQRRVAGKRVCVSRDDMLYYNEQAPALPLKPEAVTQAVGAAKIEK
ncbi:MAG: hypothetical protein DRI81_19195, partial [Chloroflexi bacterium]